MSQKRVDVELSDEDIKKAMGKSQSNPVNSEMNQINKTLGEIKHKIIVCSGKGGVGKSTIATNLAIALASQGLSIGILDVDITGPNIPKMLGVEDRRPQVNQTTKQFIPIDGPLGIKVMSMAFLLKTPDTPVIWRGPMKMKAIRQFITDGQWGSLDYLIADLPPGTSDETLDIMQLTEGSVVIVTTPQPVAMLDSRKTVEMSKALQRPVLGIVENMSGLTVKCPKCDEEIRVDLFGTGGGEKAAKELNVPFLGEIPIDIDVRTGGDSGKPFIFQNVESASTVAFKSIVEKIRTQME